MQTSASTSAIGSMSGQYSGQYASQATSTSMQVAGRFSGSAGEEVTFSMEAMSLSMSSESSSSEAMGSLFSQLAEGGADSDMLQMIIGLMLLSMLMENQSSCASDQSGMVDLMMMSMMTEQGGSSSSTEMSLSMTSIDITA